MIDEIAQELMALKGSGRQVGPFSRRVEGFGLDQAYSVVERLCALRGAAGEQPVGRKIGFTNKQLWEIYKVSAPIWNYVFDSTLIEASDGAGRVALASMTEPLIEPEVMLHFCAAPTADMSPAALLDCIDWVAPGFEVVFSPYPKWDLAAPDAAVGYGMHGALLVGTKLDATKDKAALLAALSHFTLELDCDDGTHREGAAGNVLGGPLLALQHLLADLARYSQSKPLAAGEVITTGSLTEAMPARAGDVWRVNFQGIDLKPLRLDLA